MVKIIIGISILITICVYFFAVLISNSTKRTKIIGFGVLFCMLLFTIASGCVGYYVNNVCSINAYSVQNIKFSQVVYLNNNKYIFVTRNGNQITICVVKFIDIPKIIFDADKNNMYVKWIKDHNGDRLAEIHMSKDMFDSVDKMLEIKSN